MKQREIWLINLDPTIGSEIKKTRPCIIVNDDAVGILPLKIIVPLTDWKDRYANSPWMVKLEPDAQTRLKKASAADCFQIRSVSDRRLVNKIGVISEAALGEIQAAVSYVLGDY